MTAACRLPGKAGRTKSWRGMQVALNHTRLQLGAASWGSRRSGMALLSPTSPAAKERRSLKPSSQY